MMWRRLICQAVRLSLLMGALTACVSAGAGLAPTDGGFRLLATHRGVGVVLASIVGPGPDPGSERLYQSYVYEGGALDLVAVDPETGRHQVFSSPVSGEYGAWALALGPDQNLYVGTLPHAHILQLNLRTGAFMDKGRPSKTEQYLWGLTLGADGKLYGCTSPSAKLIRYDPATGLGEDLGRMDPTEEYARSVAASDDGFVYIGIGYAQADLVAYEIATGRYRAVLPPERRTIGTVSVSRRVDGRVYATLGQQFFRVEGWDVVPVSAPQVPSILPTTQLQDGRIVTITDDRVRVSDPKTNQIAESPFLYAGKEKTVFRIGFGPEGLLYGSGYMPAQFLRINPADGELTKLGVLGGGEFFSLVPHDGRVLGAAYYGQAPLMIYDPRKALAPGRDFLPNPVWVHYAEEDVEWRPVAMIAGPENKIYLGAVPGYGKLGGPLTVWDPATQAVESYAHLIPDQSVIALTTANGVLIGGTAITGGGGSHPTQTQAKLFIWDPKTKQKVFETVPLTAGAIVDLATAPNGMVYGFGDNQLFRFDPVARQVVVANAEPLPGRLIYNSMGVGPDGRLWGLTSEGIFAVNTETTTVALMAKAPEPITGGFALRGPHLYFASGAKVYRYTLPSQ